MATLRQDSNEDGVLDDTDERIGEVVMTGPSDASRGQLLQIPDWPLTASGDGGEDPTRSDLNVPVQVGMEEGIYAVTVSLDGGGEATIYAVVDATVGMMIEENATFARIPADTLSSSGESVAVECQDADGDYEYSPYDWPDAVATLKLQQNGSGSSVTIDVSNAKLETYYTIWLRVEGTDANGEIFGGSPLTGGGATPLAPTSELSNLVAATGADNGRDDLINGFYTDGDGNGTFHVDLDFPIIDGTYPFQKFMEFDPQDERYPIDNPTIHPVAIVGSQAPFTLRIVSHCTDSMGHGLMPDPREPWFQWSFDS